MESYLEWHRYFVVEVLRLYCCPLQPCHDCCLMVQTDPTWSRSQRVLHHQASPEARPKVCPTHPHDGLRHPQRWHRWGMWTGIWGETMNLLTQKTWLANHQSGFLYGDEAIYLIQVSGLRAKLNWFSVCHVWLLANSLVIAHEFQNFTSDKPHCVSITYTTRSFVSLGKLHLITRNFHILRATIENYCLLL